MAITTLICIIAGALAAFITWQARLHAQARMAHLQVMRQRQMELDRQTHAQFMELQKYVPLTAEQVTLQLTAAKDTAEAARIKAYLDQTRETRRGYR